MTQHKTSSTYSGDGKLVSTWARIGVNIVFLVILKVFDLNLVIESGHCEELCALRSLREFELIRHQATKRNRNRVHQMRTHEIPKEWVRSHSKASPRGSGELGSTESQPRLFGGLRGAAYVSRGFSGVIAGLPQLLRFLTFIFSLLPTTSQYCTIRAVLHSSCSVGDHVSGRIGHRHRLHPKGEQTLQDPR